MDNVAALVLTAGASRRMGTPKALLPWGSTTVIQHIISKIKLAHLQKTLLVTGAHHDLILKRVADEGVEICFHTDWELGMGSTISKGIREVEHRFTGIDSVLILLVDQPLITQDYLKRILHAHQNQPEVIVASDYGNFAGAPALFPISFWADLKDIPSAQGARKLIASYGERCEVLNPADTIADIDTPEAYKKALAKYLSNQTNNKSK